jgi:hypothetical protein
MKTMAGVIAVKNRFKRTNIQKFYVWVMTANIAYII